MRRSTTLKSDTGRRSSPLGLFVAVTGVSGSGKSTLVNDILYRAAAKEVYGSRAEPGAHTSIKGLDLLDKVIEIDQAPIGRSCAQIRLLTRRCSRTSAIYIPLPESRARGYKPGRFSFNVKGRALRGPSGRRAEADRNEFSPDVYVTQTCVPGRCYNFSETLAVNTKTNPLRICSAMPVEDAASPFAIIPQIRAKLETLTEVGLGYLHLGQPSTTLAGKRSALS